METISVVIPCYRQAGYVGEAIDSVLAQHPGASEIIVVDDGSPDDTAGVVTKYQRVRYVRQRNQGLSAARNRGLQESTGEYIVFLDADDHLLPGHFATSLRTMREHPDAACVFGTFRVFGGGVEEPIIHDCRPNPDYYAILLRRNFIGLLAGVMFKREILRRVGGYRLDLKACEDYELLLRVVRQYPLHCHHQLVAEYRRHAGQMSSNLALMLQTNLRVAWLQRPYVKGHANYEEAYRHGISRWRLVYGEPLVWEMVRLAKAGDWRLVARQLPVLIRYHPMGLMNVMKAKLASLAVTGRARARLP